MGDILTKTKYPFSMYHECDKTILEHVRELVYKSTPI